MAMLNPRLKGKTVAITGASGGLGKQIAYLCAENGANVILLARSHDRLISICADLKEQYGVSSSCYPLDVSRPEDIASVFARLREESPSIDILVNNAGFGVFAEAEEADLQDIEGMFAVNVVGLIACTKEVIPSMRSRGSGHIINIASQAGKLATPKSSVYAASKHAVLGFTNSLRMEMGRLGVYVTAVNPGPIATSFFETADRSGQYAKSVGKFMLRPEKVARKVVKSMFTNRREINLPFWMNAGSMIHSLFPSLVERVGRRAFFKK